MNKEFVKETSTFPNELAENVQVSNMPRVTALNIKSQTGKVKGSHFFFFRERGPRVILGWVWIVMKMSYMRVCVFFLILNCVYETRLKLSLMTLFIHLKIIFLQYFQFPIFNNKWYSNKP